MIRLKGILKSEKYEEFLEWMRGQTAPFDGVYLDDFTRWVLELPIVD